MTTSLIEAFGGRSDGTVIIASDTPHDGELTRVLRGVRRAVAMGDVTLRTGRYEDWPAGVRLAVNRIAERGERHGHRLEIVSHGPTA